jgi:hypothetical protein
MRVVRIREEPAMSNTQTMALSITPSITASIIPAWHAHAACRGSDVDWIEPAPEDVARCRAICAGCPVRARCLADALAAGEPWGLWGGLDPDERAAIAVRDGYPPPRALPPHGTHARYARHGCRCRPCRHAHARYARGRRTIRAAC